MQQRADARLSMELNPGAPFFIVECAPALMRNAVIVRNAKSFKQTRRQPRQCTRSRQQNGQLLERLLAKKRDRQSRDRARLFGRVSAHQEMNFVVERRPRFSF